MAAPTLTVQWQLNRLAGTLLNGAPQLSEQGAANVWANVPGRTFGLQAALNYRAGITPPVNYLALRQVCNQLAGTVNEDPAYALSLIP